MRRAKPEKTRAVVRDAEGALVELERLCAGEAGYLELLARAKRGIAELDRRLGQFQYEVRRAWGASRGDFGTEARRRAPR